MKINQQDLILGFKEIGIKTGDVLEVHSSLSSLGEVEGGANSVIEALIETVEENGTIIMSAYPVTKPVPLTQEDKAMGIHWKVQKLKDVNQKTGMGAIVDEFVKRNDVILGTGEHRVCVWGKDKEKYVDGYGEVYNNNGKALLIGVQIDRCSSLHLADDVPLPPDIQKYFEIPIEVLKKYPPQDWSVGMADPPGNAWEKVFNWAKENNLVNEQKMGNAICYLFPIKPLVDELRERKIKDPYILYEV